MLTLQHKCYFISEIGKGWNPAALNTEEELDFLKLGQKTLRNSDPYWIKGSTDRWVGYTVNFTQYNANDNGTVCIYILMHFTNGSAQ